MPACRERAIDYAKARTKFAYPELRVLKQDSPSRDRPSGTSWNARLHGIRVDREHIDTKEGVTVAELNLRSRLLAAQDPVRRLSNLLRVSQLESA